VVWWNYLINYICICFFFLLIIYAYMHMLLICSKYMKSTYILYKIEFSSSQMDSCYYGSPATEPRTE
jgi:hypothetical protein